MILLVATIAEGWAAFCCGGPPIDPVVLGSDEEIGISAGLSAGATPARWSVAGALGPSSGGRLGVAVGARFRALSWLQGGVIVPASVDTVRGPGLDDPTVVARIEPGAGTLDRPLPVVTVAMSPPLGRRIDDLPPWWHASVSPGLEWRGQAWGGGLFGTVAVPFGAPDRPSVVPGLAWEVGAVAGPRGTWGAVAVGAGARGVGRGRIEGDPVGAASAEPVIRGAATLPWGDGMRLIGVAEAGIPAPMLGRNADLDLALSASVVRTW